MKVIGAVCTRTSSGLGKLAVDWRGTSNAVTLGAVYLFQSCRHMRRYSSGWNSLRWFVGTLLREQLFGTFGDLIRILHLYVHMLCLAHACADLHHALFSLFCCRAETERGLNRKHIIEGNFPSPPLCPACHPITHRPIVLSESRSFISTLCSPFFTDLSSLILHPPNSEGRDVYVESYILCTKILILIAIWGLFSPRFLRFMLYVFKMKARLGFMRVC